MTRLKFRQNCVERDSEQCLVPECEAPVTEDPDGPGEVHHIIKRKEWRTGGYRKDNGASVCNDHHRLAERDIIPPQAFWRWAGIEDPPLPDGLDDTNVDKWGTPLEAPPWKEYRENIKYPSTRHLPWSHGRDKNDTAHETMDWAMEIPLVATLKMDGGNAMLVSDTENPVRARNGQHADKNHFDMCKQMYWENNLYEKIPDHLQIFGEWLYAKHSIHYGCDCDEECEDIGPALDDYFQVFGVYDTRYDLWLGWNETEQIAEQLGLTLVPPASANYECGQFDNSTEFWDFFYGLSKSAVRKGHEGIVIRSAHPFHYGQIDERLGKYVRYNHVKEDEVHWSKRPTVPNQLSSSDEK